MRSLLPGFKRRTILIVATLDYDPKRMSIDEVHENIPNFVEHALSEDETGNDAYYVHNTCTFVRVSDFDADRSDGMIPELVDPEGEQTMKRARR